MNDIAKAVPAEAVGKLVLALNSKGVVAVCNDQMTAIATAMTGDPDLLIVKHVGSVAEGSALASSFFTFVAAAKQCPSKSFDSWGRIESRQLRPLITRVNEPMIYEGLETVTVDTVATELPTNDDKKLSKA